MTAPDGFGQRRHAVGDPVELHTKFDDSWCPGFEIAEVRNGKYWVRRRRDGELLPDPTGEDDVRAEPRTRWSPSRTYGSG